MSRVPAQVRHLILMTAAVILGWLSTDVVPWISDHPSWGVPVAGLVAVILAYVTPLIQSYGVGSAPDAESRARRNTY
jgi:hypothetical protein